MSPAQAKDIILRMIGSYPALVLKADGDLLGEETDPCGYAREVVNWLTEEFRYLNDPELKQWAINGTPDDYQGIPEEKKE